MSEQASPEITTRSGHQYSFCEKCDLEQLIQALGKGVAMTEFPKEEVVIVSGLGCPSKVGGNLQIDFFQTNQGRAVPFATGMKLGNPKLKVIVFTGDGDLVMKGGNHLMHAGRRNMDLTVVCINNFIYPTPGSSVVPSNFEPPFNMPFLAWACGAVYVARWTSAHLSHLASAIAQAVKKPGLSFIEVLSPCQSTREDRQKRNPKCIGQDMLKFYHENSVIKDGASPSEVDIDFSKPIILGRFIERDRPTFVDSMHARLRKVLRDRYIQWEGPTGS